MTTTAELKEELNLPSLTLPLDDATSVHLCTLLKGLAGRYSRCDSTQNDLAQEVMLVILSGKWSSDKNLFSLAESVMANRMKSIRQRGTVALDWQTESVSVSQLEKDEVAQFRNLGLAEELRQVAVSYYTDGLNQSEVAQKFGITQTTVSERLQKVKEVVRKQWLFYDQTD